MNALLWMTKIYLFIFMQASDIHSTGCTLKWRRPKDDGGCPIEYYQVEKLDPDTGLWIPCGRSPGNYPFKVSQKNILLYENLWK